MSIQKTCRVELDSITKGVSENFDFKFNGESCFTAPRMEKPQDEFSIGLIVGPSGSGKSTLLSEFGAEAACVWEKDKAIVSHFADVNTAQEKLSAVGFNSIPAWFRPFHVLSTGEQFRVNLARRIKDGAVIDEFTSVVDRSVAKSCAHAVRRYVTKNRLKSLVFASCHYDIIEWLQPDWVFDTAKGEYLPRGYLQRPTINLECVPCGVEAWAAFREHHYLTADINKSAKFWLCFWDGILVGFASAIAFPSGTIKKAMREHRTVVLPDYQGLGIGVRLSDAIAEIYVSQGYRYFSKTAHPRMGEYRNNSERWKPTSKNMRSRSEKEAASISKWVVRRVIAYSHEYIGEKPFSLFD